MNTFVVVMSLIYLVAFPFWTLLLHVKLWTVQNDYSNMMMIVESLHLPQEKVNLEFKNGTFTEAPDQRELGSLSK